MTANPTERDREIERLARTDHERGCRNEPPFEQMTVNHRHVHETAAMRVLNRRKPPR